MTPELHSQEWYIEKNGHRRGPYSVHQIIDLFQNGEIQATDQVSNNHESMRLADFLRTRSDPIYSLFEALQAFRDKKINFYVPEAESPAPDDHVYPRNNDLPPEEEVTQSHVYHIKPDLPFDSEVVLPPSAAPEKRDLSQIWAIVGVFAVLNFFVWVGVVQWMKQIKIENYVSQELKKNIGLASTPVQNSTPTPAVSQTTTQASESQNQPQKFSQQTSSNSLPYSQTIPQPRRPNYYPPHTSAGGYQRAPTAQTQPPSSADQFIEKPPIEVRSDDIEPLPQYPNSDSSAPSDSELNKEPNNDGPQLEIVE